MADKSQRPKGPGDGVLSALNIAIDGLNITKDVIDIAPAKAAFATVAILLTMIRVSALLSCNEAMQAHASPGHDGQQTGLRQTRAVLCWYLQNPRTGDRRKEIGRPQRVCVRCDKRTNHVSSTGGRDLLVRSRCAGRLKQYKRMSRSGARLIGSFDSSAPGTTRMWLRDGGWS